MDWIAKEGLLDQRKHLVEMSMHTRIGKPPFNQKP